MPMHTCKNVCAANSEWKFTWNNILHKLCFLILLPNTCSYSFSGLERNFNKALIKPLIIVWKGRTYFLFLVLYTVYDGGV